MKKEESGAGYGAYRERLRAWGVRFVRGGFVLLMAFVVSSGASAFQWPVANKILTATFGESRWDHFHTGIDIGGGAQEVRPVDDGEVIFFFDGNHRVRSPSSGLGSFVVLEHERGIRSLYAHLAPGTLETLPERVGVNDVLGTIGDSGASLGKHLHLELIDSELGSYVNPLVVLPALPDTIVPEVRGLKLLHADSAPEDVPFPLVLGRHVPSGNYQLLIGVYDRSEYVAYFCPMAPYRITGFFNGSQVFDFEFDTLSKRNGHLVLGHGAGARPFHALYYDDWLIDAGSIPFRVGEIQIEIVVRDVAGNERSFRMPVTVE